jgi:hypothetical protein
MILKLEQVRKHWQAIAASSSVAIGAISTVLQPPPVGDAKSLLALAAFLATGVSGLTYVAMTRWSSKRDVAGWSLIAAIALVGCFVTERYYTRMVDRYVGDYQDTRRLAGDEYTADGVAWIQRSGHTRVGDLLYDAGGNPEIIWTAAGIERIRLRMRAAYYGCVPAFALSVLAVVQAVHCSTQRAQRSRSA